MLTKEERLMLREARRLIQARKFVCAWGLLRGLPADDAGVKWAREACKDTELYHKEFTHLRSHVFTPGELPTENGQVAPGIE